MGMFKVVERFAYRGLLASIRQANFNLPGFEGSHNGYVAFRLNPEWKPEDHLPEWVQGEYWHGEPSVGPNGGWTLCESQGDVVVVGFDGLHAWNENNQITQDKARALLTESMDEMIENGAALPLVETVQIIDDIVGVLES